MSKIFRGRIVDDSNYSRLTNTLSIPPTPAKRSSWKHNVTQTIVGTVAALTIHAIIFTLLMVSSSSYNPLELYSQASARFFMKNAATNGLDDNVVLNISTDCSRVEVFNQPQCVEDKVAVFYRYVGNESGDHKLRSPDEFVAKGGVCRDIAVTYAAIFLKMNWTVEYNFPVSEHVTTLIKRPFDCPTNATVDCSIFCEFNNDDLEFCSVMGETNE
jgi:hypothetical protein